MDTTLTVQGMHCSACVSLITMEIEDLNLGLTPEVKLLDDDQGQVVLTNATVEQVNQVKAAINKLENYHIND